jgi:predicted phage-related endonuclease
VTRARTGARGLRAIRGGSSGKSPRSRPYRRLCDASSPDWHAHRRSMVTGSEMAILFGKALWPKELSAKEKVQKLARSTRAANDNAFPATRSMAWGSLAEKANMEHFAQITGVRYRHTNALLQSTACPRIGATLDGVCRVPSADGAWDFPHFCSDDGHSEDLGAEMRKRAGEFGVLEMKQTEFFGKKNWDNACPEYYALQCQTQMFVMGLDWCLIVAKIGCSDIRAYFVDADPLLHEEMVETVERFWAEEVGT